MCWGGGRGAGGARACVRACVRCTRRLTCPLLPNANFSRAVLAVCFFVRAYYVHVSHAPPSSLGLYFPRISCSFAFIILRSPFLSSRLQRVYYLDFSRAVLAVISL